MVALRPVLLRSACQTVGLADAEDLVQGTIERCLTHLDRFRPDTNLLAWLRRIMSNLMVDGWRRQGRVLFDDQAEHDLVAPEPYQPPPWGELDIEDVRKVAAELPEKFRVVFKLHYFDGLTYASIGARLNMQPNTVGTRLLRARRQVHARLLAARTHQEASTAPEPIVPGPTAPLDRAPRRRLGLSVI
ncbi:MAG TPA: RNA polymerase sigma factor [Polyangia bacterium]|jgi:RNA polymerase sigma-70 factor (ECF subfamily)|nr:RNA polymerase sigma factor [Polyangia bacterium]